MLKTPQTSSRLGKRQESNSDLGWALELARAYDAGPFVAVGSAVSTSIITHVYNFGKGIIGFAITTTQLAKEALALHPNVAYCGLDKKYVRQGLPPWMTLWVKRPDLNHHLWHIDRINERKPKYDKVYPVIGNQGEDVTVYVVDGVVDPSHPEFGNRVIEGLSFLDGKVTKIRNQHLDLNGHGTQCAGIIAGKTVGIAPRAKLINLQVLGPDSKGSESDILKALEHIANNEMVVNVRPYHERLLYP